MGCQVYFKPLKALFGEDIDYGMLIKTYGEDNRNRLSLESCRLHRR